MSGLAAVSGLLASITDILEGAPARGRGTGERLGPDGRIIVLDTSVEYAVADLRSLIKAINDIDKENT